MQTRKSGFRRKERIFSVSKTVQQQIKPASNGAGKQSQLMKRSSVSYLSKTGHNQTAIHKKQPAPTFIQFRYRQNALSTDPRMRQRHSYRKPPGTAPKRPVASYPQMGYESQPLPNRQQPGIMTPTHYPRACVIPAWKGGAR